MRYAITGATGLLGRNFLFEIIKQNIDRLEDLEILLLGRPHNNISIGDRLDIIISDGFDYIGMAGENKELISRLKNCIVPIPFNLIENKLGLSDDDFHLLTNKKIDIFVHLAAKTDFRHDDTIRIKLEEINVKGAQRILELVERLNVDQFVYIGSAYSCGSKTGIIKPNYVNINEVFRNPYEKTKLRAEILVREYAKRHKINVKIFRPSTICGRLIENRLGSISKYDVFYAWGAFFLRLKLKQFRNIENIFEKPLNVPIRIHFNKNSGLNIVPVDFVAKALYCAILNDSNSVSFHLANSTETKHCDYIQWMLDYLNISGYGITPEEPSDKNDLEKIYYRSVGRIFSPYIIGPSMLFNIDNLYPIYSKYKLNCPIINRDNFTKLLDFARNNNFGLTL